MATATKFRAIRNRIDGDDSTALRALLAKHELTTVRNDGVIHHGLYNDLKAGIAEGLKAETTNA